MDKWTGQSPDGFLYDDYGHFAAVRQCRVVQARAPLFEPVLNRAELC
jgi:hypothetical protein